MNVRSTTLLAAAGLGILLAASQPAAAFTVPRTMKASAVVEDVACRTTRSRIVLPGGRVIYPNVRTCAAPVVRPVPRCKVMRERIVRPNGTVIFRSVRRCG
jgi:hypothetical protein